MATVRRIVSLGMLLLLASMVPTFVPSASADVIYTYTGNVMNYNSGCPAPCILTVTLDLAAPLPINYQGPGISLQPLWYSFTDGTATMTGSDAHFFSNAFGVFSTGAQGQPTLWYMFTEDFWQLPDGASTGNSMGTLKFSEPGNVNDSTDQGGIPFFYQAFNYSPGTWSAVPEPSTLFLLGSGLLGLMGMARRRRLAR